MNHRSVLRLQRHPSTVGALLLGAVALGGCGTGRPAEVSPNEIPELEARLAESPDNGDLLLRYAGALFSAGQCDSARTVATAGAERRPRSAIAPLVIGQCHETAGDYDAAVATYGAYLAANPDERGSDAVRARELIALRARATQRAQAALAREAGGAQPADPQTLAILPIDVAGDSQYQPLGRGLAQIMTADLALIERFRMVERLQVQALFDEMDLGQTGRVDPNTAARVGRLLLAGRMVQGLANIPSEDDIVLNVNVVQATGEITAPAQRTGRLRDILRMEKEIVVELAAQLGYVLSQSERQMILNNGTADLTAFLAYSNGLVAEDLGDYNAAALFYSQAVQSDPNFQAARNQQRAAATAPAAQQASAGQVTTMAAEAPAPAADPTTSSLGGALSSSIGDVAATTSEQVAATNNNAQTTQQASNTATSTPNTTATNSGATVTVTGIIRVVFRLP